MRAEDHLFLETDDACAICGLRGPNILTIHHIDDDPSHNAYDNRIVLCFNCHQAHHQGKPPTLDSIRQRKRHLIEKTATTFGLNAMKIADRNAFGVVAMPFLLYHLVDMGYMTKEENQMSYGAQIDATARFAITPAGSELLRNWGL